MVALKFPRWIVPLALLLALGQARQFPHRGHSASLLRQAFNSGSRHISKGTTILGEEGDACITGEFPLKFRHSAKFNIDEGLGFLKDDSLNLDCECEEHECKCYGEGDDCDEYSAIWFYVIAYAHQFGALFYDLPEYEEKYHLQSMMFWTILGTILFWTGLIVVIYQEIKAVSVTRERDERRKLIKARAMERSKRLVELEAQEAQVMAPRPYVTVSGAMIMFIGLFCQLVPFCHLLRELGFMVEVHGLCILYVLLYSLMLSACITLTVMGIIWSCTRGVAAGVFLLLALLGDLTMFGGSIAILVWLVLAAAVIYLYFSYLPAQYKSAKDANDPEAYPWWLQDAGDFAVETDLSKIKEAFSLAGANVASDLTENPIGQKAKELAGSVQGKSEEAPQESRGQMV